MLAVHNMHKYIEHRMMTNTNRENKTKQTNKQKKKKQSNDSNDSFDSLFERERVISMFPEQ